MPPIQSLPVELLAHIFTLSTHTCFRDDDSGLMQIPASFPFDPANIITALSISGVNRHWNRISLSTRTMWTDICISTELPQGDDWNSRVLRDAMKPNRNRLFRYLERSKNAPIDIFINFRVVRWDVDPFEFQMAGRSESTDFDQEILWSNLMNSTLDLIMPHTRRWRSITILADTHSAMHTALDRFSHRYVSTSDGANLEPSVIEGAPSLERIVLKRCNQYMGNTEKLSPEISLTPKTPFAALLHPGNLPRLKELSLHGVLVDWSSLPTILQHRPSGDESTNGLRILELSTPHEFRPSIVDLRQILQSCPRLQKLVMNVSLPIRDDYDMIGYHVDDASPIILLHLQELSLGFWKEYHARCVLNTLDAPNLMSLRVANMEEWELTENCSSLLALCGTPPLATLGADQQQLIGWNLSRASSKARSSRFPSLRELTLHGIDTVETPTSWCTLFDGLPKLQHLTLDHCNYVGAHEDEEHFSSKDSLTALLPVGDYRTRTLLFSIPCPTLHSLRIRCPAADAPLVGKSLHEVCVERSQYGAYSFQYHVEPVACTSEFELFHGLSLPRSDPRYIEALGNSHTRDPTVEIMGGIDVWVEDDEYDARLIHSKRCKV